MKIIHKARPPKARRAIVNAASKWEPYVYDGFLRALRQARRAFDHEKVAGALARGVPEIAVAYMPWPELEQALGENLLLPIRNAVADGAAAAVRDLKPMVRKGAKPPAHVSIASSPIPNAKWDVRDERGNLVERFNSDEQLRRWMARHGYRPDPAVMGMHARGDVAIGVQPGVPAVPTTPTPKAPPGSPPPRPTNFQIGADVSFTLDNPRTQTYLARHGARLVRRVRDETTLAINRIVTEAHRRGQGVTEQAELIATALRRDMGLNQRQAGALSRYEAGLAEQATPPRQAERQVNEYRDRLINQRARMIARHETLTASNAGQQEVWQQATEHGLIEPDQKRKWVTQPGLNSDNPCPICKPMNGQLRGLNEEFVSPYDNSAAIQPPIHIGCLTGDALVSPRGRILAASKRWVDDEVVIIQVADALPLSCTPNHPVLTPRGWVAAGRLKVGDEVAHPGIRQGVVLGDGQDVDAPARAEDVAEAFFARLSVVAVPVPVSAPDFHGDGAHSQIAIVGTDCLLVDGGEAVCAECRSELALLSGDVGDALLPSAGGEESFLERGGAPEGGGVWLGQVGEPLSRGAVGPNDFLGATVAARLNAHLEQARADDRPRHPKTFGHQFLGQSLGNVESVDLARVDGLPTPGRATAPVELHASLTENAVDRSLGATEPLPQFRERVVPGQVEPHDLVFRQLLSAVRHRYRGWVFNFQTDLSYYTANGYVVHNCECVSVLHFED